jgi:sugar lactone lactonase YvrE
MHAGAARFTSGMGRVLAALLLLAGTPVGDSLLDHLRATRKARLSSDTKTWLEEGEKALALAPDHPDLLISVARAQAANGHVAEALGLLRQAIDRGAGVDVRRVKEFQALPHSPEVDELTARASANLTSVARAHIFAMIPDATADPEGVEYDPVSRRVFTGTSHGEILQIDPAGTVSTFVARGGPLREVLGIKVDAGRRLLWAVTGVFPDWFEVLQHKPDAGISGVVAYSLDDGKLVQQAWLDERPVLHGFNDLAVARRGDVYITDTMQNSVYLLRRGRLSVLLHDDRMSLPNGIVLAPDQRRLYVATTEGLTLIDSSSGKSRRVRVPRDAAVNSIDGLSWDRDALIGVQGSPYLSRVIRMELSPDGTSITRTVTLNARNPRDYNPTTAAIGEGWLYVVASAPAVDTAGTPLATDPKPQVVRIPLD